MKITLNEPKRVFVKKTKNKKQKTYAISVLHAACQNCTCCICNNVKE